MSARTYRNPILAGDWPDPSVLRVGGDYYMTTSAFRYAPGLLIWHSRDLVNWRPLMHALADNRGDVWAPDLVQHGGRFFIYYKTWGGNHVVHADEITGPWSEPINLHLPHIDPGHVVDADGTRYLHLSDGHVVPLAPDGLSAAGPVRKVFAPWPIPTDGPRHEGVCLEGPKLFWYGGWCHMLAAQGGTAGPATSHMVVHARSRTALGPWEHSPHNPIVRTVHRNDRWWSKGHGTAVEGPDGRWYLFYHAYERGYHTLGRQTLMEPVEWTPDGWLRRVPGTDAAGDLPVPAVPHDDADLGVAAHGLERSDDFTSASLGVQWQFFGGLEADRFTVGDGQLALTGRGATPADSLPLLVVAGDHAYEIEVDVAVTGDGDAGLCLFYSPAAAVGLLPTTGGVGAHVVRPLTPVGDHDRSTPRRATLRIVNDRHELDFLVRPHGSDDWRKLTTSLEVSGLHHNVFGGFLSLRPGLYCSGHATATFRRFRYSPRTVR